MAQPPMQRCRGPIRREKSAGPSHSLRTRIPCASATLGTAAINVGSMMQGDGVNSANAEMQILVSGPGAEEPWPPGIRAVEATEIKKEERIWKTLSQLPIFGLDAASSARSLDLWPLRSSCLPVRWGAARPHRVTASPLGSSAQERAGPMNLRSTFLSMNAKSLPSATCRKAAGSRCRRSWRRATRNGNRGEPTAVSGRMRTSVNLLRQKDIDAVYIATPDHWHVAMTIAAQKAGKHCHTEKPLGVSIETDLAALKAVRKYRRSFLYGAERRSSPVARHAVELVLNGRIGKVKEIYVVCPASRSGGSATPELPVPERLEL